MQLTKSFNEPLVDDSISISSIQVPPQNNAIKKIIVNHTTEEAYDFITQHISLNDRVYLTSTISPFNVDLLNLIRYQHIINLRDLNEITQLNNFFLSVNTKIPQGGLYVNSVETFGTRKARILKFLPFPFNWIQYLFDMIFTRVFPKLRLTKKLYYALTRGQRRVYSRAEILGRLYYCGFKVLAEQYINKRLYFVAMKAEYSKAVEEIHYGPVICLKRVGKNGRLFNVYKLRTMHAYSEYLQKYVFDKFGSSNGDKANDDFRINSIGKVCRRFWIDELPMLINLLKGDLKIVGVRPLSAHKFGMYPKEAQQKRCLFKPGLIPPFYADLPSSFEELVESEMRYIDSYSKSPLITDFLYFFKAFKNIFFKGARSN